MEDIRDAIVQIFEQVADAHHEAFKETGGFDPDWPIWYAENIKDHLGELLSAAFSKSELVYLLVLMEKQQNLDAPGSNWRHYYAGFLMERYL
jgi:hypothetical protein